MSEYMIMTDSTVDLPKEYLTEELGVPYIPLTYLIDGQSYEDMIGLTGEEFFAKSQGRVDADYFSDQSGAGTRSTGTVSERGKDILYIAFSSGLSGTYNSIRMAAEELQEEYPERKLIVIDSLCACLGRGASCVQSCSVKACRKESGRSGCLGGGENKLHIMHNVTIDDLFHLQEVEEYQRLLQLLER